MKALAFGEVLWDMYPAERFIGGAPFNFASHLARLGAEVCMLSAVGNDPLGVETRAKLHEMGVNDQFVATVADKPTGQCLVTLRDHGVPRYNLLADVAYDYISADGCDDGFDLLYFGSLALRSGQNRRELQRLLSAGQFAEVFVDVNIRPPFYTKETVAFCLENATILKISAEELPVVLEQLDMNTLGSDEAIAKGLSEQYENLKLILLTFGAEGASVYDCRRGCAYACPAHMVEVASTVGAGDSFSAAFVWQYLSGESMTQCLDYASRLAAFVVSKAEAVPEYSPQEI